MIHIFFLARQSSNSLPVPGCGTPLGTIAVAIPEKEAVPDVPPVAPPVPAAPAAAAVATIAAVATTVSIILAIKIRHYIILETASEFSNIQRNITII